MKHLDDAEFTGLHRGRKVPVWRYATVAARFTPGATRPMTQQRVCVALAQDRDGTAPRERAAGVRGGGTMKHLDDAGFTTRHRGFKVPLRKYSAVAARFTPRATRPMTQQRVCVALPREIAAVVCTRDGSNHPKPQSCEVEAR